MGAHANEYAWDTGRIDSATVADSAAGDVVASNKARRYLAICNNGANDVYLGLGVDAVLGKGIYLKAGTGTFESNANNLFHGRVSAIGNGAGSIAIQEGT